MYFLGANKYETIATIKATAAVIAATSLTSSAPDTCSTLAKNAQLYRASIKPETRIIASQIRWCQKRVNGSGCTVPSLL